MINTKKVVIIDYQLGNLHSVKQACIFLGYDPIVTSNIREIVNSDAAILPGVGAFGDAMNNLKNLDLIEPIKDFINSEKPLMGICLGLQLLFSESEEFGQYKGLNIIEGYIKRFDNKDKNNGIVKVPQIQWNTIAETNNNSWKGTPLESCSKEDFMYFVHSYYALSSNSNVILSETEYGGNTYCSSIIKGNVFACQFHPEKSGERGLKIYKHWFENLTK